MADLQIIWDLEDDPDGNYCHIVVEGHGVTREEVEEVLRDENNLVDKSHTSGNPITFGWTSMGQYIAVVWQKASADPDVVYPLTAYPVLPPRKRKKR